MPTSHPGQIQTITELILAAAPTSLLDVGVGFGKFGFLTREYLDVAGQTQGYGERRCRIEGIEIFEKYLTPVHKFIYDKIHIGPATELLPKLEAKFDLVLLIDVIEHFTREDGLAMLSQCARVGRNVLVSTPKDIGDQGEVFSNPHEAHISQWRPRDFAPFENAFLVGDSESHIAFFGTDGARVRNAYRGRQLKQGVKRLLPFAAPLYRKLRARM